MPSSPQLGSSLFVGSLLWASLAAANSAAARTGDDFRSSVAPMLERLCVECHESEDPAGDLDLERFSNAWNARAEPEVWSRVREALQTSAMPPQVATLRPSADEVDAVLDWIDLTFGPEESTRELRTGRTTLRRLNRLEYQMAVLDIFGVDFPASERLPADSVSQGFEVIGDALSMPPMLFEKYLDAADEIALQALPEDELTTPFQARYYPVHSAELGSARTTLTQIARLAWRGEVNEEAVDALLEMSEAAVSERERLRNGVMALLISPRFLFRVEREPANATQLLSGAELATRLAAFLWSSVPDERLLEVAATGQLEPSASYHDEIERMLNDARTSRLAFGFASGWLQLERLANSTPDPQRFPSFDAELESAMRQECELFFDAMLRENRKLSEFLRADFTFVNERLAQHYGIAGVKGAHMRRVPIPEHLRERRGGLLGMGALLTATSHAARTSPVLRGKWVLEALLATPPPPPPPGVGALAADLESLQAASIRERLETHRKDPACAACHAAMDGLGFALENYDATGAWRDHDGDFPIDARADLPGEPEFEGPRGLRERLLANSAFQRAFVQQLATFAIGRALSRDDRAELDELLLKLPTDPSVASVLHGLCDTNAFRVHRREALELP